MSTRVMSVSAPAIKMSPPSNGDAMEISTPPGHSNPNSNANSASSYTGDQMANGKMSAEQSKSSSPQEQGSLASNQMPAPPPAAAAAVHQPKIVQTAFIHKLYNMLEDPNIQHLISWSSSAESFIMSPSADFSKVLSQYFKHTNISSFVRQLNMYGFHKERDVFHTGSPDTTLWEFKHGNGNFKRGDLAGLREIKRRASRHALVHRENNYPKPNVSHPGTPAEPIQAPPESAEARLANIEHSFYDLSARLQRSEDSTHHLHIKNQAAVETMSRLLQFNQELSRAMLSLVSTDTTVYRDVVAIQSDMQRQAEAIRSMDDPHDTYSNRHYYGSVDHTQPVSPRQLAQDDSRRGTLIVPQARSQNFFRPPVPSNLSTNTRRPYGSISGTSPTQSSPLRHTPAATPASVHPMANLDLNHNNLARRHTAADIRAHGWQSGPPSLPGAVPPAALAAPWPPSPGRVGTEDQRIRESLSSFSLQTASQPPPAHNSHPTTPPPLPFSNGVSHSGSDTFGSWSWGSALRDKNSSLKDSSAPQTRRGSMAHILNPSDTAERSDEDESLRGEDDRKRKRMM